MRRGEGGEDRDDKAGGQLGVGERARPDAFPRRGGQEPMVAANVGARRLKERRGVLAKDSAAVDLSAHQKVVATPGVVGALAIRAESSREIARLEQRDIIPDPLRFHLGREGLERVGAVEGALREEGETGAR